MSEYPMKKVCLAKVISPDTRRYRKMRDKNLTCGLRAKYMVRMIPMCAKHAGIEAIKMAEENSSQEVFARLAEW